MKKQSPQLLIVLTISLLIFAVSCDSNEYLNENPTEKSWVFLELEKQMKNDTSDFYLYGEVNQSILDKINKNESSIGIFKLSNIRYINDKDLLQIYEDESDRGAYLFRIEDIQTLRLLKADPILTFNEAELHEQSLDFKMRILAKEKN